MDQRTSCPGPLPSARPPNVWALRLSCEPPTQSCTFEGPGAPNTTKISREDPQREREKKHEKTSRERKKESQNGGGRGKKREISGHSPFWRKIAPHQITASDLNTFTNTSLINMRMKFVMTTTTKSGDELISLKETFGLCEGRAEQH